MNERGLFLDLERIARGHSAHARWWEHHTYETPREHRMHVVCSTLESLGYMTKHTATGYGLSAWRFTEQGVELYTELSWGWATG